MSRRGLLPLIVVTCAGVGGGMYTDPHGLIVLLTATRHVYIWSFDEREQLRGKAASSIEVSPSSKFVAPSTLTCDIRETTEAASTSKATEEEVKKIAAAEATASRNASTESVLSVKSPPISWWLNLGLWSAGGNTKDNASSKPPSTAAIDPKEKN